MRPHSCRKCFELYPYYYFTYWAMSAVINQYLGIYYQDKGFDGIQIGLASSIYSVSGIGFSLMIGCFVDRYDRVRPPLLAISFIGFLGVFVIRSSSSFPMILCGVVGFSCCMAPPGPIVDEQLIRHLGVDSSRYSVFRRWGPVGFSLGSIVSAGLVSRFGINTIFELFFILNFFIIIIYILLPNSTGKKKAVGGRLPFGRSLKILFRNSMFYFCMVLLLLWGICEAGMFQFFNIFMISKGYDVALTGWFSTASMLGEFVAYMVTVCLLGRRTEPRKLIFCAFVLVLIHYLGVIYLTSFLFLMVVRILGGAGFAFVWSPVTEILFCMVPSECSATVQECKSIMVSGVGYVLGQMLCGIFYKTMGLSVAYKVLLIFPVLAMGIVAISTIKRPIFARDTKGSH